MRNYNTATRVNSQGNSCVHSQALELYDRGFSVIPLKPGSKKPKLDWKRWQTEKAPREKVEEWFSEPANIGIVTGRVSNLVVVDLDSQDAIRWFLDQFNGLPPLTLNVSTGRGAHYYFKYPEDSDISHLALHEDLEVIGNRHYVVAPGSDHPSGKKYETNGITELAELPEFLFQGNNKTPKAKASNKAKISSQDELKAVGDVKADLETIEDILNHSAFKGKPKTGSNNGRFLTHLITALNLGIEQEQAVELTTDKYPNLSEKTVRDSAKATYKKGYGLSIKTMVEIGISQDDAEDLFAEVVATAGWRGKKTERSYLTAEEFNRKLFKATFILTLTGHTEGTYKDLAAVAGVSQSTLAQKDAEELPDLVKIASKNGNGIRFYNYLPFILKIVEYAILQSLTTSDKSFTNSLSSKGVKSGGLLSPSGLEMLEGGEDEGTRRDDDERAPP